MNWDRLLTPKRYGHELSSGEKGRSHFHKDHDRIIFSSAFRRLGRKTQVHPMALNDHIHTRLTHSIEVGSLGRSLGIRAGELIADQLPSNISADDIGTIVQSACLAHDIGNPPFGHAGEYAIRDWFKQRTDDPRFKALSKAEHLDLLTFEGNAQGFRVVTCIENHLFDGGLRLTYPTLGTLLKYPWSSKYAGPKGKFSCYQTELGTLSTLASDLGLLQQDQDFWSRHPLNFLMEAADDICYAIVDLEDAIELNLLNFEDVKPILLQLCGDQSLEKPIFATQASSRRKISALRGRAMEHMVGSAVSVFADRLPEIMLGQYSGELLSDGEVSVRDGLAAAKKLARERVFPDTRKAELEVGAYTILGILVEAFIEAVWEHHHTDEEGLGYRSQKIMNLMGIHAPKKTDSLYFGYMRALDFISGMTDSYASYLARQIGGGIRV